MNKKIFDSPTNIAQTLSAELSALSEGNKPKHISLSGGSTPKVWFTFLTQHGWPKKIYWENIHFWWGDERCVPPDNPESNFGAVNELLFQYIDIPAENLHRIRGEDSPQKEAVRYAEEIEKLVPKDKDGVPMFDWIHLGMGDDGHTASLFPGQTDYAATELVIHTKHPENGQDRISKTARLLMAGKRISYLVTGEKKAALLRKIQKATQKDSSALPPWPAARIHSINGITEWYLDQAAASLITPENPLGKQI